MHTQDIVTVRASRPPCTPGASVRRFDPLPPQVTIDGCAAESGGVGIDLTQDNVILDIRPDTAASRAADGEDGGLRVGDRVVSVDGIALTGRVLTSVIQPADSHTFEVDRNSGWSGFSIDETDVNEGAGDDGFAQLNRIRTVTVRKVRGELGIKPEVHCRPGGQSALVKVAKVQPGSRASECGAISVGDVVLSIDGQPLACAPEENPLSGAMKVVADVPDGAEVLVEIESDTLLSGWVQKKGVVYISCGRALALVR